MADITPTGPPYPHPPEAGSNAIGTMHIGASQVGDIPAFKVLDTVASQYANSTALMGIIDSFAVAVDQTENFERFYDDIWNIETATGYGLAVWGRIVGINCELEVVDTAWFGFAESEPGTLSWNSGVTANLSPAIGFAEALPSWQSLGWGTFGLNYTWTASNVNQGGGAYYSGTGLTNSYRMSDQAYRTLIMAKAAQNLTDCSIPAINNILMMLFPHRGNAYVTDGYQGVDYFGFAESRTAQPFGQQAFYDGQALNNVMTMTYTFDFQLSAVEMAIVQNSGVLPAPTGVTTSIVINV
jgi:hypothetical protein